jgi:chemotaxis protein MotA
VGNSAAAHRQSGNPGHADRLEPEGSARRLLALEPFIEQQQDLFHRRGLQMLVDGAEPEVLRETLELDLQGYEQHHIDAAKVWQSAGGYSPTIGILGAVMGLIHVMENLSDPSKLGSGIAVAFVATIYGVGGANLFFLPVAGKLRYWVGRQVVNKELFIQGIVGHRQRRKSARNRSQITRLSDLADPAK